MMRYVLLSAVAALALGAFPLAAAVAAPGDSGSPGMERMQNWAADHEAVLDARLAGLKAGLKLTADQDKLWTPFESAVRDAAKLRMAHMKTMMERAQKMQDMAEPMQNKDAMKDMSPAGPAMSPVDRLETMAQRMTEGGAALKQVADAAKPLYASLDDSQKRLFGMLGHEFLMMGHGSRGMGMMGEGGMGMMGGGKGMMGEGGMGMMSRMMGMMGEGGMEMMGGGKDMMGREGKMKMMGGQSDDNEDSSGEQ